MWLDKLANALVNMSGNGFDPDACPLPAFRPKLENTAKLPDAPKKTKEAIGDDLLTAEEMLDWRYCGYGERGQARVHEVLSEKPARPKAVQVDFDETPSEMYGITEREYGEMLAYNPPLTNLKLASKIKAKKADGVALADIAAQVGQSEQTVRHYSSALFKASPIKKSR